VSNEENWYKAKEAAAFDKVFEYILGELMEHPCVMKFTIFRCKIREYAQTWL